MSDRRAVLFALALTSAFAFLRAEVYVDHPVYDVATWSARDREMTRPRLLACAACACAMAAWGGPRRWGVHGRATARGLALLAAAGAGIASSNMTSHLGSSALVAQGLWTTLPVAVWEELCYRGLLYRGLRSENSPLAAGAASSAIFMVMHVQAQSYAFWPWIFAYGLASCAAVESGTGLPWLIFAHWTCDVLSMSFGGWPEPAAKAFSGLVMAATATAGAHLLWTKRPRRNPGPGPSAAGERGPGGAMH